jgi:hypothetical protein
VFAAPGQAGVSATGAAAAGPFTVSGCSPEPEPATCSERALRRLVRASRTIVRPGRKNGGTTLIFQLSRTAVVRITIARVYPTCKRVGSFTVRAHAGMNQIRFRGRFRGRPLPEGGYRLIVRVLGAERDAAAVPIVIARGKMRTRELRKARSTIVCNRPVADLVSQSDLVTPSSGGDDGSSVRGVATTIKDPLTSAALAVARKAKGLAQGLKDTASDPFDSPFVLTLVGLIALASALLGVLVLAQIARSTGFRGRAVH